MSKLVTLHVALPDGKTVTHENVKNYDWGTMIHKSLTVRTNDGTTIEYRPGEWWSFWNGEFSISYPPGDNPQFSSIKPGWVGKHNMTRDDLALEWAREELQHLWNDLVKEERLSQTGSNDPSVGMLVIMERIKRATAIVGPIDWRHIPITWLQNGKYKQWANYMGIEYMYPPEEVGQGELHRPYKAASEWPKWTTGEWVDKP